MTRTNKNKGFGKNARLKLRFKAWRKGKMIVDTTRSNKARLQYIIRNLKDAEKYYLKVTYGKGYTNRGIEEIYNDGDYFNKRDLLNALSIFASKNEVDDYLENFAEKGGRKP